MSGAAPVRRPLRTAVLGVCAVAIIGSLAAYVATGMYAYTRFRDAEIERVNAEQDLSALFEEVAGAPAPTAHVRTTNAFGLLPSGPGRSALSVATVAGPALVVMVAVLWAGARARRRGGGEIPLEAPAKG